MASRLLDRVDTTAHEPILAGRGVAVQQVVAALEGGELPAALATRLRLEPADILAGLAYAALGGEESEGPALVQERPARRRLQPALEEPAVAALVPQAARPVRLCLAAGLLQVHDFWEPSHQAAQEADDLGEARLSAYWHGIAHRREPDAGNAAYWFRRVGRHPVFAPLAEAAGALLQAHGHGAAELAGRLIRGGSWDPFAMIDLCTRSGRGGSHEALARRLQRLEMALLLDATAEAAGL